MQEVKIIVTIIKQQNLEKVILSYIQNNTAKSSLNKKTIIWIQTVIINK